MMHRLAFLFSLLVLMTAMVGLAWANPGAVVIHVDQFGYLTGETGKIAVVAVHPGADPGRPGRLQVRDAATGRSVFESEARPWRALTVDPVSGDRTFHFDFSDLEEPGRYLIAESGGQAKSRPFSIGRDVFKESLYHATRAFYYQRCGAAIPPRHGKQWHRGDCHTQQRKAPLAPRSGARIHKDVAGGWHDAGDYNKYVPAMGSQLLTLMRAYQLSPDMWRSFTLDVPTVPGVPDLISEIKWGTDWLLKMQDLDGGVHNRVAAENYPDKRLDDPAADRGPYYFTSKTTWATSTFCAIMARGHGIFAEYERAFPGYGALLLDSAEKAWRYLQAHPEMRPENGSDGAKLAAGDAGCDGFEDRRRRLLASAELFAATGKDAYGIYFEQHYLKVPELFREAFDPINDPYVETHQSHEVLQAYFSYARSPWASESPRRNIRKYFSGKARLIQDHFDRQDDPYMAFIYPGAYTWGSNMAKMLWAAMVAFDLEINPGRPDGRQRLGLLAGYLHYLHGRNPLGMVYLSNMGRKGAGVIDGPSPLEIYHSWFSDGSARYDGKTSAFGPAPGFLVGGPNRYYSGARKDISGRPPMRAYEDSNGDWPDRSWEINEPSLSYQAAYVLTASYVRSRFTMPARSQNARNEPARPAPIRDGRRSGNVVSQDRAKEG